MVLYLDLADRQRREAHEEIGLPPRSEDVYNVAVLEPIVTVMPVGAMWKHHIIVTRESVLIPPSHHSSSHGKELGRVRSLS